MLTLVGCGGGGSSSTTGSGNTADQDSTPSQSNVEVENRVSGQEAADTTPKNLYNISEKIGTPPSLPAK